MMSFLQPRAAGNWTAVECEWMNDGIHRIAELRFHCVRLPKKKFIASVDNSILSYHKSVSKSHGEVLFCLFS